MKKFLLLLIACLFVIPTASYASAANDRTDEGLVPDFSEDFESYEVDTWIENLSDFAAKWSNNVLDNGAELGMDSHLRERAKVVYENGTDGNKVLYLDNRVGGNSFFYIAPKGDYRCKNYTVTFRMQWVSAGWISCVVRKDQNIWYNGCNNVNATLFVTEDGSVVSCVAYRNMPGAADQVLNSSATLDIEGYTVSYNTYRKNDQNHFGQWFDIRYEINEKTYKVYVDDTLVLDLYYPSRKVSTYGYLGFHGCTAEVYFDDIDIDILDTEAPPALEGEGDTGNNNNNNQTESESASESETTSTNASIMPGKKKGCKGSLSTAMLTPIMFTAFVMLKKSKKED